TDNSGVVANSVNSVITVNSKPAITLSPSTSTIDTGNSVIFSNTVTGGTLPFTYAYTYSPSTGVSQSGNTFTFANAGTYNFFETVTDNAGIVANSVNSVITVNNHPSITLSPSTASIDTGNSVTFSNTVTGGTLPFTYAYTYSPSTGVSQSGNTFTFANAGTYNFFETVTDNAGIVANSVNSVITVNNHPSITLSPSTSSIDTGNSVTFSNTVTGGTLPFTYAYTYSPSTGVSQSGNTFTFANAGTYNFFETVTDNAGIVANSVNSVITVNNHPSITLSPSTSSIDTGNSVTFSNTVTGGTLPFTYAYTYSPSTGVSQSGNTFTFANAGTYNFFETVTDNAGIVANSVNSVITVNNHPSITLSPSTASIDTGNSVTFSNTVTGGTLPFTYAYTYSPSTGVSQSGNTFTFANAGTYNFFETVTDNAGIVANSVNSVITVNNHPSITLSPSTASIDTGNSVTFSNTVTGGTLPFTYAYTYSPSTGVSQSGNTFTFAHAGT